VSTTTRDTGDTGDSATWYPLAMSSRFCIPFCHARPILHMFHLLRLRCSRTSTPGLSGGLVTGVLSYGVRLTLVLGHAGVDMPVLLLAHIPFFPA
jgi:hypothetical protein